MSRTDVEAAVTSLWQEVCAGEEEAAPSEEGDQTAPPEEGQTTEAGGEEAPVETGTEEPLSPCPWEIRFYPDQEAAELVEVLLKP